MYPLTISIEITNSCNSRCEFCIRKYSKRENCYMSFDMFKKIVDDVKENKTELTHIILHGFGDPLLHPEFEKFSKYLYDSKIKWGISTNCQELDKHIETLIKYEPYEIIFSINAFNADTHKSTMIGLDFEKVRINVEMFLKRLKGHPKFWFAIYLQYLLHKNNIDELDRFIEYWTPKIEGFNDVSIFVKPIHGWNENKSMSLYDNTLLRHPKASVLFEESASKDCIRPMVFFIVFSDGNVGCCCFHTDDVFGIGNIKDNTITELYNNDRMKMIRESISRNCQKEEISFCKGCT